jgi:hypothetical protein
MNTISIAFCPDTFSATHRIVAEHQLLFETTQTKEVHLVVLSPFFNGSEKVTKVGDNMWIYPCSTKNIMFSFVSICKKVALIQKRDQFVSSPWIYNDSGKRFGFVYKEIGVVLTDEILLSQLVGLFTAKFYKALLSIIFIRDEFTFLYTNPLSFARHIRTQFSRYLIKQADAVSLSTVLLQNRYTKMYGHSPAQLEKMHILPRYVDFNSLSHTEVSVDLHKKYPQFKFIIILHAKLLRFGDLQKCTKIIDKIKPHFNFIGFVVVGSSNSIYLDTLAIQSSSYKKYFAFEGNSVEWQKSPVSYFKTANLFVMRPDIYMYDTLLMYAFAATCPTAAIATNEIKKFFDGNDLFLLDSFEANKISEITLSIVNKPAEVKERVISMKQGVSAMFGTMALSYREYLTSLYNSFLFIQKK